MDLPPKIAEQRDDIALRALVAMISNPEIIRDLYSIRPGESNDFAAILSRRAYRFADEMQKARQ